MKTILIKFLAFGFVLIFALNSAPPAFAHGGDPRLEISAEQLRPGAMLQIRGVEFESEQEVTIALIGSQVDSPMGKVISDAEGIFTQDLILPQDLAAGTYAVHARTYDHVVISPLITVWGTAITDQEDNGIRDQSDVQFGLLPTSVPGVAPTMADEPMKVTTPDPVKSINVNIMTIMSILFTIGLIGAGFLIFIQRRRSQ